MANCSICLDRLGKHPTEQGDSDGPDDTDNAISVCHPCRHMFHAPCLERWHAMQNEHGCESTCPNCRGEISTITVYHNNNNNTPSSQNQEATPALAHSPSSPSSYSSASFSQIALLLAEDEERRREQERGRERERERERERRQIEQDYLLCVRLQREEEEEQRAQRDFPPPLSFLPPDTQRTERRYGEEQERRRRSTTDDTASRMDSARRMIRRLQRMIDIDAEMHRVQEKNRQLSLLIDRTRCVLSTYPPGPPPGTLASLFSWFDPRPSYQVKRCKELQKEMQKFYREQNKNQRSLMHLTRERERLLSRSVDSIA